MDPIFEIELEDCPICRGVGAMQDEQGWCVSVACMDCGAETAHAAFILRVNPVGQQDDSGLAFHIDHDRGSGVAGVHDRGLRIE